MFKEKIIGKYAYVEQVDQIGSGQFSTVFKGYNIENNKIVAIKQISKLKVKGIFQTMLQNEIEVLKTVNHQNILKLNDFYETPNNYYIVTDYCETNLLDILKQQGTIPEPQARKYVIQVAQALKYLHSHKIIHRDLKPSNILLKDGQVQLADFGFAQTEIHRQKQETQMKQFQIGSPLYMAPETIFLNHYDYSTDVWALGILYYEMIFGVVPFFSMEFDELIEKLNKYKQEYTLLFKRKISDESTIALRNLLAYYPRDRCNLIQLQQFLAPNTPKANPQKSPTNILKVKGTGLSQVLFKKKSSTFHARTKRNEVVEDEEKLIKLLKQELEAIEEENETEKSILISQSIYVLNQKINEIDKEVDKDSKELPLTEQQLQECKENNDKYFMDKLISMIDDSKVELRTEIKKILEKKIIIEEESNLKDTANNISN